MHTHTHIHTHTHTPKNAKNLRRFLSFSNCVKQFVTNYSTLKYILRTLERTLTKESWFWLDGDL